MKSILVYLLVCTCGILYAQQETQFTQFMINPFLYNPALSGAEDYLDIKTAFRNQWTGIDGAPRSFYVSAHKPISNYHAQHAKNHHEEKRHSVGGIVSSDRAGDIQFSSAYLNYSFTKTLSKGHFFGLLNHKRGIELSFGTNIGAKQYSLDLTRILNQTNPEAIFYDPAFNQKILPDASLGTWLYVGDHTFMGLSVQQILGNKMTSSVKSRLFQHYNFVLGTECKINSALSVLPSAMIRKVYAVPLALDLNARLNYQEKWFGGFSWRVKDSFSVLLGMLLHNKFEIAYAYDYTYSRLSAFNADSHEIILGVRLHPKFTVSNAEDNWK